LKQFVAHLECVSTFGVLAVSGYNAPYAFQLTTCLCALENFCLGFLVSMPNTKPECVSELALLCVTVNWVLELLLSHVKGLVTVPLIFYVSALVTHFNLQEWPPGCKDMPYRISS
jgi:hypothetical protein